MKAKQARTSLAPWMHHHPVQLKLQPLHQPALHHKTPSNVVGLQWWCLWERAFFTQWDLMPCFHCNTKQARNSSRKPQHWDLHREQQALARPSCAGRAPLPSALTSCVFWQAGHKSLPFKGRNRPQLPQSLPAQRGSELALSSRLWWNYTPRQGRRVGR